MDNNQKKKPWARISWEVSVQAGHVLLKIHFLNLNLDNGAHEHPNQPTAVGNCQRGKILRAFAFEIQVPIVNDWAESHHRYSRTLLPFIKSS